MTATFTFRGDQTLSKTLELPISVQDIGEQFSIDPRNVFLIAKTGHMKGRPIQPENAKFLKLENGQKYEVVAAPRDKCRFTYSGRTISGTLLADFQKDANNQSCICLNKLFDHTRTPFSAVSTINDATETLFQNIHRRFEKIFSNVMQLPKSLLEAIDVPNRFENNVIELREIMENTARNYIKATVALLQTEIETVFQDIYRRFEKIFINVMQLPKSLLEIIDVLNKFENNVIELREIMENTARNHIKATVALLQTEINAIILNFKKPLDLASELCVTVREQWDNDVEQFGKIEPVLESKERAHEKMKNERDLLNRGKIAEHQRAKFAETSYDNAMQMPDVLSWTLRAAPQQNYETGKDIKLMALLEFVDAHVLEALPDIKEIDEHKWVNQGKYQLLLSSVHSREPLVQTDEAKKLRTAMLKIDLSGKEKETLAKTADCEKKVAMEKLRQYDQLIRQKKDEIARIARENKYKRQKHAHLSNKLDALDSINMNLKQITRLFKDINTDLLYTKEYIHTVLNQVILPSDPSRTSERDSRDTNSGRVS